MRREALWVTANEATVRAGGIRSLNIPPEFQSHSLVRGRVFYTLPAKLLAAWVSELEDPDIDPELERLEWALSQISGDHSSVVGFRNGQIINSSILRRREVTAFPHDQATVALFGSEVSSDELRSDPEKLESRSKYLFYAAQGYAGWLLTNPAFIAEHDVQMTSFASPSTSAPTIEIAPDGVAFAEDHVPQRRVAGDRNSGVKSFCLRWRLAGMAGPNLPIPLLPQTPALVPSLLTENADEAGCLLYFPDTVPLPGRDELRALVEDALRGRRPPDHLAEWTEIVRNDNAAKNRIGRYGRVLEVQHYCRSIKNRYPQLVRGNLQALEYALATFLGVSRETIRNDISLIRQRLGTSWISRGNQVPAC